MRSQSLVLHRFSMSRLCYYGNLYTGPTWWLIFSLFLSLHPHSDPLLPPCILLTRCRASNFASPICLESVLRPTPCMHILYSVGLIAGLLPSMGSWNELSLCLVWSKRQVTIISNKLSILWPKSPPLASNIMSMTSGSAVGNIWVSVPFAASACTECARSISCCRAVRSRGEGARLLGFDPGSPNISGCK